MGLGLGLGEVGFSLVQTVDSLVTGAGKGAGITRGGMRKTGVAESGGSDDWAQIGIGSSSQGNNKALNRNCKKISNFHCNLQFSCC